MGRWKIFETCHRKSLNYLKETAGRNIDVKGISGKVQKEMRNVLLETGKRQFVLYNDAKFS